MALSTNAAASHAGGIGLGTSARARYHQRWMPPCVFPLFLTCLMINLAFLRTVGADIRTTAVVGAGPDYIHRAGLDARPGAPRFEEAAGEPRGGMAAGDAPAGTGGANATGVGGRVEQRITAKNALKHTYFEGMEPPLPMPS